MQSDRIVVTDGTGLLGDRPCRQRFDYGVGVGVLDVIGTGLGLPVLHEDDVAWVADVVRTALITGDSQLGPS